MGSSTGRRQRVSSNLKQSDEGGQASGPTHPHIAPETTLPLCYVERPGVTLHTASGTVVRPGPKIPLIPIDQLPPWIKVVDVPTQLSCQQAEGLTSVGIIPGGSSYSVHIAADSSPPSLLESMVASQVSSTFFESPASQSHDKGSSAGAKKKEGSFVEKPLAIKAHASRQIDEGIIDSESPPPLDHLPKGGYERIPDTPGSRKNQLDSVYPGMQEHGLSISRHAVPKKQGLDDSATEQTFRVASGEHNLKDERSSGDDRLISAYSPVSTTTSTKVMTPAEANVSNRHNTRHLQKDNRSKKGAPKKSHHPSGQRDNGANPIRRKTSSTHSNKTPPPAQSEASASTASSRNSSKNASVAGAVLDNRCFLFARFGMCKWGVDCKFHHETPEEHLHVKENKETLLDFDE